MTGTQIHGLPVHVEANESTESNNATTGILLAAERGMPQFGHALALRLTCCPHVGQEISFDGSVCPTGLETEAWIALVGYAPDASDCIGMGR